MGARALGPVGALGAAGLGLSLRGWVFDNVDLTIIIYLSLPYGSCVLHFILFCGH